MKSAWPWCTFLSYSWIWFIEILEVYVCCVCLPVCLYSLQNWSITSFVSSFSGFGVGIALALVKWVWWCSLPAYFIEQTEEHWCWLSLKVCLNPSVGLSCSGLSWWVTVYRPSLLITWLWVLLNLHDLIIEDQICLEIYPFCTKFLLTYEFVSDLSDLKNAYLLICVCARVRACMHTCLPHYRCAVAVRGQLGS